MIDIKNLKDSIDNVSMESALCVLDAMFGVIDKNEYINEYDENNVLSDIFMESVTVFMESKNRERDKTPRNEISKWMEKKGYWYTGDNPKKKKECNRMYHFLQQHDFRPSDETYKSDIIMKDGSNKRVKLKIDISKSLELTAEEKAYMKKKVAEVKKGESIDWDIFEEKDLIILQKLELHNQLIAGKNSFFDFDNDEMSVSSKILKGKQSLSQGLFKHEEGHADSNNVKKNNSSSEHKKEVHDIKHKAGLNNYKNLNRGVYVNPHDASSEEGYADAYSASHTKLRTKKRGTRSVNKADLLKYYKQIDAIIADSGMSVSKDDCIHTLDEKISNIDDFLKNTDLDGKFEMSGIVNIVSGSFCKHYLKDRKQCINKIKALNDMFAGSDMTKENVSKILKELEETKGSALNEKYGMCKDEIDEIIDILDNFVTLGIAINESSLRNTDKIKLEALLSDIDDMNSIKHKRQKSVGQQTYTPQVKINKKDVINAIEKFGDDTDAVEKFVKNKIKKSLMDIRSKLVKLKNKLINDYKMFDRFKDISTVTRYEFAKQYVNEYFNELYEDYFLYG